MTDVVRFVKPARVSVPMASGERVALDTEELSAALYLSGAPVTGSMDPTQAARVISDAVAQHGVEAIRAQAAESRRTGLLMAGGALSDAEVASVAKERRAMWPDEKRRSACAATAIEMHEPSFTEQLARTDVAVRAAGAAVARLDTARADVARAEVAAQQAQRVARWQAEDTREATDAAEAGV